MKGASVMMHADLIDQDDLLGQLRSIGFEMPSGATAEQACAEQQDFLFEICFSPAEWQGA